MDALIEIDATHLSLFANGAHESDENIGMLLVLFDERQESLEWVDDRVDSSSRSRKRRIAYLSDGLHVGPHNSRRIGYELSEQS